ncbi:MAG: ssDNA-binding protein, mitochondrial [Watsoniomyces obsoletus]|nr:MAG: ssDNA-binding protein, mitochondrial [Watsoniomyces obsoletus]
MASRLENLPPELLLQIFSHMDDMPPLYALIRASPVCYRVFSTSKLKILSDLVHRIIPPEALPDAVAAAEASNLQLQEPIRETISTFLQQVERDRERDRTPRRLPLLIAVRVCRLHHLVQYLLKDFTEYTIERLNFWQRSAGLEEFQEATEVENTPNCGLSLVEEGRLRRAFYGFELYAQLFYAPPHARAPLDAIGQAHLFFGAMAPWAVEELACIEGYALARLTQVFTTVEDDFVALVVEEDRVTREDEAGTSTSPSGRPREEISAGQDAEDVEDEMDSMSGTGYDPFDGDIFFSSSSKIQYHMSYKRYMLSLGVGFLYHVLKATGEERTDLVLSQCEMRIEEEFLALSAPPKRTPEYRQREIAQNQGEVVQFEGEELGEPNEGWLWANRYRVSAMWNRFHTKYLQHLGYVFWDHSRLSQWGLLEQDPRAVNQVFYDGVRELCDVQVVSAEERVKALGLKYPTWDPTGHDADSDQEYL